MSQPLIRPWPLIRETWSQFTKTWETTIRISIWFIAVGLISAIGTLIPETIPGILLIILVDIIAVVISLWTSIRLYQTVFALERGESVTEKTTARAISLIWPLLIVEAYAGLATLGGFLLLIIPGIYIGIRFAFSQISLIDPKSGKRGGEALKNSWALTKGRFWPIFGRMLFSGLLFGLAVAFILSLSTGIVGLVAGPTNFAAALASDNPPPAIPAALTFIQSIVQAALIPLIPIFQVKLYQSLRASAP